MNVNIEEISQNVYEVTLTQYDPDLLALAVRAEDAADSAEQNANAASVSEGNAAQSALDAEEAKTYITELKPELDEAVDSIDGLLGEVNDRINEAVIQSTANFVPLNTDGTLPTPVTDNNFTIVGEGTYGSIVVNTGYLGILSWDGSSWSKVEEVEMPTTPVVGEVEEGDTEAVSGGEVFNKISPFVEFGNTLPFDLEAGRVQANGALSDTSVNWLRTDRIDCKSSTTYSAVGLGNTHADIGLRRVSCYNGTSFLGFIPQEVREESFTFTTIAGTDNFVIQVEGLTGVATDIPNSPYWQKLNIAEGDSVNIPGVRGESIIGEIKTEQIESLEMSSNLLDKLIREDYLELDIITTNGALLTNGMTTPITGYRRTSVTSTESMATVSEGKSYVYTGEITSSAYAGVLFISENLELIGFGCSAVKTYDREELIIPEGTKYIATCSYGADPVLEEYSVYLESGSNDSSVVHVDSTYAGGESNGSLSKPYATITEAIENSNGSTNFLLKGGEYRETIPFDQLDNGKYSIFGKRGERIRFLGSNKITEFNLASGQTNTYVADFSGTIPSGNRFGKLIFEDGNPSRPILTAERHPLQKALSYRLPFTPLTEKASIIEVENNAGTFYHDLANSKLYIHTSNSSNPNTNGFSYEVMARDWSTVIPVKTNQMIDIHLENVQFFYGIGSVIFQGFNNVSRRDVTAIATTAAGAFRDDTSNIIAYNDEAAFCNGDGINGHFNAFSGFQNLTDHRSMQPTAIYFDPWCHDNWDDGISHHENHRVSIYGGLIEYNDDGGVRASNDAGYTIYNAYSRKNGLVTNAGEGFSVVNPTINENRNGCKMVLYSCFTEGNAYGYASIMDNRNILEAINCISRENINGELYANYGTVISRNTRATNSNSAKLKVTGNGGVITVLNDEILE